MTDKQVMQMALEALENADFIVDMAEAHYGIEPEDRLQLIEALRQALAQPEQMSEPIYLSGQYVGEGNVVSIKTGLFDGAIQEACHMAKLAQPEQEPIAYVTGTYGGHFIVQPIDRAMVLNQGMALYTAPVSNQQPVAYADPLDISKDGNWDTFICKHSSENHQGTRFKIPLYTAPPKPDLPIPPECETEAERNAFCFGWWKALEVNRKEWQGLTDDEMYKLWVGSPAETEDRFAFARATEAKLKENNCN